MRNRIVWERACGLTRTVVEAVDVDEVIGAVIVSARPEAKARQRCGQCGRRCPKFDRGEGRRRWRALDAGTMKVFIEAAKTHNADIIALSALLTTTMPAMKQTVEAAREAGLNAKVIIGGAPVTQQFCDEIGADGYSPDAASAVDLVMKLMAA